MQLKSLTPMGAAFHLEQLYDDIRLNRMADIPILNDKLKVQAVGFRAWNHHVLGVLITPWFMNLMLLPTDKTDWTDYQVGSKHSFVFEAGSFEFIVGEEAALGQYMSCSMFSPMFDFAGHEVAVETAEAIVAGMFDAGNKEVLEGESLKTEEPNAEETEETEELGMVETMVEGAQTIGALAKENLDKPISRRELLRGGFLKKATHHIKGKKDEAEGL